MDFAFDETQEAIRSLCKDMFSKTVTPESLQALEATGDWIHEEAWQGLVQSELLGLAVAAEDGGAGLGLIELCLVLQQIGRTVAPVPFLSSIMMGALPLSKFGNYDQKQAHLPGLLNGTSFLTTALIDADSRIPMLPATRAEKDGGTWCLNGEKSCVSGFQRASNILIPAQVGDEIAVFIVPKDKLEVQTQYSTNAEPLGYLGLKDVRVGKDALLGTVEDGRTILRWILDRAIVGQCAIKLGIAEKSLFMTAEYTSERKQFGIPVATFQAVSQRAADAYIDVAAMRLTLWRAVWALTEGLDTQKAVAVAKYWSCAAGHRVAAAAQHLHGGMGFDRDYPLHRYFLWSKHLEFTLGGASAHLEELGRLVAAESSTSGL